MGRISNARKRLLIAASDLLWEKSYYSVTVDEVCARAGVRKGSLYHFFNSKSALVVAALQHFWETVARPAYEEHFSRANSPLARITGFLAWVEGLQRENYRKACRVPGWPFFTLACEIGGREPTIVGKLCEVEFTELRYFESAIRDALVQGAIEKCVPQNQALALRAVIQGMLARARVLNDPNELNALTALPTTVLRLTPTGKAMAIAEDGGCCEAFLKYEATNEKPPRTVQLRPGELVR